MPMSRTYYTYLITAPNSPYYYFGVSHVKIPNATKQQCHDDGYYGSGGNSPDNKFQQWKKSFPELCKDVLQTFDNKQEAYDHERELVGDRWRSDPWCLNSIAGGIYTGEQYIAPRVTIEQCDTHGAVKHLGGTCCTCTATESVSFKMCEIHGETKFSGDICRKCLNTANITIQHCPIHGETKHIGAKCYRCRVSVYHEAYCDTHGMTPHRSGICARCRAHEALTMQECGTHGQTRHMFDTCISCTSSTTVHIAECPRHGVVKHRGTHCSTCVAQSTAHNLAHTTQTKHDCWVCDVEVVQGIRAPAILPEVLQKVCELCTIEYTPHHKNQIFCSNPHDWECAVCHEAITPTPRRGKQFYSCMKRDCRWEIGRKLRSDQA